MLMVDDQWLRLAVASGIGLLIGVERERSKGSGPDRASAGIRTFATAAVVGAVGEILGGTLVVSALALGTATLLAVAYYHTATTDPGLTTEVALLTTLLLGAFSIRNPALAGASGVFVAIVLAAKVPMHRFARSLLSNDEVNDALILAAATFIVLPILPNRYMGPYNGFNPSIIWRLAILMMVIEAAGHIMVRIVGMRYGLPLSGFIAGFVSSLATIGAMGAKARSNPDASGPAAVAALLSSLATFLELGLLVGVTSRSAFGVVAIPLLVGGLVVTTYSIVLNSRAVPCAPAKYEARGRAFDLMTILIIVASLALVLILAAALHEWFGEKGARIAAGVAGLADAHTAGASIAALVASGSLAASNGLIPILIALTTNTLSKATLAFVSGGQRFALRVVPGLALSIVATWLAAWFRLGETF